MTDLNFEYTSTDVTFRFQTPVTFDDMDTMDHDICINKDVKLIWEMEVHVRPDNVRAIAFSVPNQTIELNNGEMMEINDVKVDQHGVQDDYHLMEKVSIVQLTLDQGEFHAEF